MPVPVIMPKLEMAQETALVLEWLKKEGEKVSRGEPLLSVETDKITIDVESPADGTLARITVAPNDVVPVTTVIAYLLLDGETEADLPGEVEETTNAADQSDTLVTQEDVEVPKPLDALNGFVDGIKTGPTDVNPEKTTPFDITPSETGPRATPAARAAARAAGLASLQAIMGSGPRGRIQKGDVLKHVDTTRVEGGFELVPLQGMRRRIAERMQTSYREIPHIYLSTSVDVSSMESSRAALNSQRKAANLASVSLTALLVKFTAETLVSFPLLNSSLEGENIKVFSEINIGVAVALEDGLIVPVIQRANVKPLPEVASELLTLTEKARSGALLPADVTGGTFTITNLGTFGVEEFTALINPGQTGILAVGAVINKPVVFEGGIAVRPIMRLTLGADHRLVDGAVAARFLARLKETLEKVGISED